MGCIICLTVSDGRAGTGRTEMSIDYAKMDAKKLYNAVVTRNPHTADDCRKIARDFAPKGKIGEYTDALRAVSSRVTERRKTRQPVPNVRDVLRARREARYTQLFRSHGPVPAKSGAGKLSEYVYVGSTFSTDAYKSYGSKAGVAKSYGHPVWDHTVRVTIPGHLDMRAVNGVVTVARYADFARQRIEAIPCHWPEKGAGYSAKWVPGWLYRGTHIKAGSAKSAQKRVDAMRREQAQLLAAKRLKINALRSAWIGEQHLRAAGACQPGIDAARREAERLLGAEGPIGGVLSSWAAHQKDYWAGFVARAAAIKAPEAIQHA